MIRCALAVLSVCLLGCTPNQQPVEQLKVAHEGLISAALSSNGQYLFSGSFQHGGALWDIAQKERNFDWNLKPGTYSAFSSADFSEDGRYIATSDGFAVTLWDATSGETLTSLQSPAQSLSIGNTSDIWSSTSSVEYWERPGRILDIAFSKQYLLLALENQIALLVDSTRRSVIGALPHADDVLGVAMDDAANLAITGARDGTATVWSLAEGDVVARDQSNTAITFVDISADGQYALIAAFQGPVKLMTIETGETRTLLRGNPGITTARFGDYNKRLLLGTSRERVMLFDLESTSKTSQWQVPNDGPWHKAAIIAVAFAATDLVAVASNGYVYRLSD